MSKRVELGTEARNKLKSGVDQVADAVSVTLGAKGRNVIIKRPYQEPHITKDGVTVAQHIELEDHIEELGAQVIKNVAGRAAKEAGDGTTTATIIAQSIIEKGLKNIAAGANPMDLKRGIDEAVKRAAEYLKEVSREILDEQDVVDIATVSANNDPEIGKIIAEAVTKATIDGLVNVEESKTNSTYIESSEGMEFYSGLLAPYFVTNEEKMIGEYEDVNYLIYNGKVDKVERIIKVIDLSINKMKPLVIIANDFDDNVVAALSINKVKKGYNIIPVKAPFTGDNRRSTLEDIAIQTGGQMLAPEKGIELEDFKEEYLGSSRKAVLSQEKTSIIGGLGDREAIENRVKDLKNQIENSKHEFDDDNLRKRISKLIGGVATIYVGGTGEIDVKEKIDRVDDAVSATRAAIQEGVVAGGGVTLFNCAKSLRGDEINQEDQKTGFSILTYAMQRPIKQIALNSGKESGNITSEILRNEYPWGYNAKTDEFGDMFEMGIIDPTKVTRVALESAASVAGLILTTEVTITNKTEKDGSKD